MLNNFSSATFVFGLGMRGYGYVRDDADGTRVVFVQVPGSSMLINSHLAF